MSNNPSESDTDTAPLSANEFFQSLENIPDYIHYLTRDNASAKFAGAETARRNRFRVMNKSFAFPQFDVARIIVEFSHFKAESISFGDFLLLARSKYPHISAYHCDIIYAYITNTQTQPVVTARRRAKDVFAESECVEIISYFNDNRLDCAHFVLLQYVFHHYALIFECPSVILFFQCDYEHNYFVTAAKLAIVVAQHFKITEKQSLRFFGKRKTELIALQDFLTMFEQTKQIKELYEQNVFKKTLFDHISEESTASEV